MRASFIFPVYKSSRFLIRNIRSVKKHCKDYEIIVVADCAEEKLKEELEREGDVTLVLNDERRGKVNALNSAISLSSGDFLVFVDADVLLPDSREFFVKLERYMESYDLLQPRFKCISFCLFPVEPVLLSRVLDVENPLGIWGCFFVVRREIAEKLNGFRKVVSEDIDFGIRARRAGARYVFAGDVEVYVEMPRSVKSLLKQRLRWAYGLREVVENYGAQTLTPASFLFKFLLYYFIPLLLPPFFLLFLLLNEIERCSMREALLSFISMPLVLLSFIPGFFASRKMLSWKV